VAERIPDGELALIDGLVASTAPEVLVPLADRLRMVVLVHMPLGHRPPDGAADEVRRREHAVLEAAAAVVTTSRWSRGRLLALYQLARDRVHVAEPGVDRADLAPGTAHGGELLCVAAVSFEKGHDVLVEALASISEQSWRCLCVGSVDRDPPFVEELRRRTQTGGLDDRVSFEGPRTAGELDRSYGAADLLVLPSRAETYGMVVAEALAHGLPIVATDVGGVTEALGHDTDGSRPGLLVPPEDSAALAAALRAWLGDETLRGRLRRAARERRRSLCGWSSTASVLSGVLADVAR
jgi:glycosyltransferase involved in cell wall biosynthesis